MTKTSVLLAISVCFLYSAIGQVKWGANAGVNISSVNHVETLHPKPLYTFQFSGFAMIPVGKSLLMYPSIGYRGKGYRIGEYHYPDTGRGTEHGVNYVHNYLQLSAPVALRCNTNENFELYAGAGPYLAYLLKVNGGATDLMDEFNRMDVGLDLSIAMTIHKRWVIALASDLGLSRITSSFNATNISSGITVGYLIN